MAMKRSTASSRTLCQAPLRVSSAFPAEAQEGTSSTTEKAMPRVCTQWGSAVKCRWCEPAHIYMNVMPQKLMIESR